MEEVVSWLKGQFEAIGIQTKIVQGYGNPIVLGFYQVSKNLPTCLLYGHYDVQGADKDDGRKQDPFNLFIGKEKIYGRWVVDNKGQLAIHLQTIFSLIKENKLGYNLIILLEWDEGTGSRKLGEFLEKYKDSLQADFSLISDGEIVGDVPCVDVGFRGWFNAKLTLHTANTDLHSGLYGGAVPNAVHEMNKLLAQLFDRQHRVTVPYFYYDVEDISFDEKLINAEKEKVFDFDNLKKNTWVGEIFCERDLGIFDQIGLRPTIQVTGMESGYVGEWFRNSVPCKSIAHLNFRLVFRQDPEKISRSFAWWLKSCLPAYVRFDFDAQGFFFPYKVDSTNSMVSRAKEILKDVYWNPPLHNYSGGGLPIVKLFAEVLGLSNVLVPLANDDCNMHGVNENFAIDLVKKGFEFSRKFFEI